MVRGRRGAGRRAVGRAVVAGALLAGGFVAVGAQPAAAEATVLAPVLSTAWTDSAAPTHSFGTVPDTGLPLGTSLDAAGVKHTSRVYVTFDLTPFAGRDVLSATTVVKQVSVNDCAADQTMELRTTDPTPLAPTWQRPRKERGLAGSLTPGFCPQGFIFGPDITAAVTDALTAGRTSLPLVLRLPGRTEGDPAAGRTLVEFPGLSVRYNSRPAVPVPLKTGRVDCTVGSAPLVNDRSPVLSATVQDDDNDFMNVTFAIWPTARPAERVEFPGVFAFNGSPARLFLPSSVVLADATEYSWAAKAADALTSSAFSAPCRFLTDFTAPAAPTVTSTAFPAGGTGQVGTPGDITFTATDADVTGFSYFWAFGTSVPAFGLPRGTTFLPVGPGGTATISAVPPSAGPVRLEVTAVDRAGNLSATTTHEFFQPSSAATLDTPTLFPLVGAPVTVTATPNPVSGRVVEWAFSLADGDPVLVPAAADGTATFTFVAPSFNAVVQARARSANGWISSPAQLNLFPDERPRVSSVQYPECCTPGGGPGVKGTFTFAPGIVDVVSYTWSVNGSAPVAVKPSKKTGTATVTFTPKTAGFYDMVVTSTTSTGTVSAQTDYFFVVAG